MPNLKKIASRIEARPTLSPLVQVYEAVRETGDYTIYPRSTTSYDIRRRIASVQKCSTYLEEITIQTGETQTVARHACNDPYFCPVCAENRTNKRYFSAKDRIKKAAEKGLRLYFVTMTVKDETDPYLQYDNLVKGIREFQRIGQKGRGGEWSKVKGAYINFEAKKGEGSKQFHIHAHAIFAVDGILDYRIHRVPLKQLSKALGRPLTEKEVKAVPLLREDGRSKIQYEWFKATGGNGENINCVLIDKKEILGDNFEKSISTDVLNDLPGNDTHANKNPIRELFKYPAKMSEFISDFSFDEVARLYDCIRSRRNFRATGIFSAGSNEYEPEIKPEKPLDNPNNLIVNHSTFRYKAGDILNAAYFNEYSTKDTAIAFDRFCSSGMRKEISQARGYILAEYNEVRRHAWQHLPRESFVDACKAICGITRQMMKAIQENPQAYYYGVVWEKLHDRTGDRRRARLGSIKAQRPKRHRIEQTVIQF
jgi:hypothetical protein